MVARGRETAQKKRLGDLLLGDGLIHRVDLESGLREQQRTGRKLGETLLDLELLSEHQLIRALAAQFGHDVVDLLQVQPDPEAFLRIPEHLSRKHQVVPFRIVGRSLAVAMSNPLDYESMQDLSFHAGCPVVPFLSTRHEIQETIDRHYHSGAVNHRVREWQPGPNEDFQGPGFIQAAPGLSTHIDLDTSREDSSPVAPVIRLLNRLLAQAIEFQASDIHIEPGPLHCQVRYRVDGHLQDEMRLPTSIQGALASRIKVLAHLDIAEHRQPQDGAVRVCISDRQVDLRISVLPVQFGEKLVIRILDQAIQPTQLSTLGFTDGQMGQMEKLSRRHKGILLVTGPTGSGKTTTLYALVNRIRSEKINLMTVEDPIEYTLEGINQVQVNTEIGRTFSKCLKGILRQDPNVILVGEIRDSETAGIAFRAAMTGHLVLSTLHTNDAPSTITRLVDLGVPRYLVASQLIGVIAQRLFRKLCSHCKQPISPPLNDLIALGCPQKSIQGMAFWEGHGCSHCRRKGYQGRSGIFEILVLAPPLRNKIIHAVSEHDLRSAALAGGMVGLWDAGLQKVREEMTSIAELIRLMETEEHQQTLCQNCARPVALDFSVCPYCTEPVVDRCTSCRHSLQPDWKVCPYCSQKTTHSISK